MEVVMVCTFISHAIGLGSLPEGRLDKYLDRMSWVGQIGSPVHAGLAAYYQKDNEGLKLLTLAFVISQVIVWILKIFVPSLRPNGSSSSFPSGHTTIAFIAPIFLMVRYGIDKQPLHCALALTVAVAVGISRVLVKAHWKRDVIAGAIIGSVVTYLCLKRGLKTSMGRI
jgi:membrane-associated phospholipid phosphatase